MVKTNRQISLHDLLAARSVNRPFLPSTLLLPSFPYRFLSTEGKRLWMRSLLLETKKSYAPAFTIACERLAREIRRHLLIAQIFRQNQTSDFISDEIELNVARYLDWINTEFRSNDFHDKTKQEIFNDEKLTEILILVREELVFFRNRFDEKIKNLSRFRL